MHVTTAFLWATLAGVATPAAPAYRDALLELHKSVVEIPSNSGLEAELGGWLSEYFTSKGWSVVNQSVPVAENTPEGDSRVNIIATPQKGVTSFSPKAVLTTHIDTVPPHIDYAIEEGDVSEDTVISGRGSVDAKGSLAAMVVAVDELVAAGAIDAADVAVAFVVGEETTGDGMKALSEHFSSNSSSSSASGKSLRAVIFGEPTEGKLACGHKGILGCTLGAKGVSGHSGYPEVGKSATQYLIRALDEMLAADLGTSDEFGNTTVNVGKLTGGAADNVIAPSASAGFTVRVALGAEEGGQIEVKERLDRIVEEVDPKDLTLNCTGGYPLVKLDCNVEGFETAVMKYGTDIPGFQVPGNYSKILYGPGTILVAHTDHENITVGNLESAVEGYQKLVQYALR